MNIPPPPGRHHRYYQQQQQHHHHHHHQQKCKNALILLNDLAVKRSLQVNTFYTVDSNNKDVFQCVIQVGMLRTRMHVGVNKKEAKRLAAEEMLSILAMTPVGWI